MRGSGIRSWACLGAVVVLLAACGGDDDEAASSSSSTTTSTTSATTTEPSADTAAEPTSSGSDDFDTDAEGVPVDYLTYGTGAFPVRYDPATQEVLARAVLDGRLGYEAVVSSPTGPEEPMSIIVELPGETTFTVFGIPAMSTFGCCSGTHFATVQVEVSSSSPDDGYETIATFDIDPDVEEEQRFDADAAVPARWVRVTVSGRQVPDPEDYRGTAFTELLGYGTQQPIEVADETFTGRWLTGGGGGGDTGNRLELIQNGSLVTGCGVAGGNDFTVSGGIENGLLRYVVGEDTVPKVAVINSENELVGAEIGRSFGRVVGVPGGAETSCSPTVAEEPPNPITDALDACSTAVVYGINFDVDKADIRPDAEPALSQIIEALTARPDVPVVVEGHTDSDGSDQYNLDLSDRRAASVVSFITGQGVDAGRISSVGRGETEPVADNETAAGKAANRRVEIEPQC